jgi:hypothetical protein
MVAVVDGSVDRLTKHRNQMELWRRRVAEQRDSGLSVRVWSEANGCSTHSFYVWRAKLGLGVKRHNVAEVSTSVATGESSVRLTRVRVEGKRNNAADSQSVVAGGLADGSENQAIRLRLGHGRELLWPMSLPMNRLAELLRELERLTESSAERRW